MKINHTSIFKAFKGSLALIFLTLFIQGCGGGGSDSLSPVSNQDKILAFGDSLTEGFGVSTANSYPTVLSELSGRTVVNAGITGEKTAQGLARLADVIDDNNPYLMILLEGGNDFLNILTFNYAETKQNLSSMIDLAKGKGVQVILLGVPDLSLEASAMYQELADEHSVVYDGDLVPDLLKKPEYKSDPVHFNEAGYEKLAEGIYQLLIDNGAL